MDHETVGSVLPFLVLALAIGAAIRHLLRKTPFPYTVALLIFGLILGLMERNGWLFEIWPELSFSVQEAADFDPHLILFVFLPTLIFESAFAMDTHIFKKIFIQAVILAAPGLILSALFVAWLMKVMFAGSWDWKISIMFGAIVCATDPVAVVALLREMGTGKQLATLIEGESLLNDGTAIVVFLVVFAAVVGGGMIGTPLGISGKFLWVSIAGPFVGILIAAGTILWIRHVFNDALVEITVTIVAAYLTWFLSENVLHVSGVLAVVALGLVMSAIGRTSISPEVEEFLHRFWEMMAYLLNTLIFVLVGVVIADKADVGSNLDWRMLAYLYVGIHVVRAMVIVLFYPIMKRTGYGLPWRDGVVLWWGGLRGAVGLSLALVVAQDPRIPDAIGGQILFLCAGIVVLTLTVNGTTIRSLISVLGMNKVLPAKVFMLSAAARRVHKDVEETVNLLKRDRFLCGADWERVRTYLPDINVPISKEHATSHTDLAGEARRRILSAEKRSYWRQHHEGFLGPDSVRRLVESTDMTLDRGERLDCRKELEKLWEFPAILQQLKTLPVIGNIFRHLYYGRLAVSYDVARGFVFAQEEVSGLMKGIVDDDNLSDIIEREINVNRETGLKALTNMREAFPEITIAIETRTAVRSVLNHERHAIQKMMGDGVLDEAEGKKLIETIETRMKQVFESPPAIEPPEPHQLLREISWLSELDEPTFERVHQATTDRLFAPGENLIEEDAPSDSLCVIARGTVKVFRRTGDTDQFLDLMGPGSVIGEMGVLTGSNRTATVRAETPVNSLWITASDLQAIMNDSPELQHRLWQTAGARFAENDLIRRKPYSSMGQLRLRRWLLGGQLESQVNGKPRLLKGPAVLLSGEALVGEKKFRLITPPAVIEPCSVTFNKKAKVFLCPSSEVLDANS